MSAANYLPSPAEEATRIVVALQSQMEHLPSELARLPATFYREFCTLNSIAVIEEAAHSAEQEIRSMLGAEEKSLLLGEVVKMCAACAVASRTEGDFAWRAALDAQRHAGVALACIVSTLEKKID